MQYLIFFLYHYNFQLVLLIIFVGIDIYEFTLNNKAETEIENTANSVFDSLVQEIESMDMQTQEIMEPFKDMVIEIKPQWIKIALLAASSIIGVFIGIIKKHLNFQYCILRCFYYKTEMKKCIIHI